MEESWWSLASWLGGSSNLCWKIAFILLAFRFRQALPVPPKPWLQHAPRCYSRTWAVIVGWFTIFIYKGLNNYPVCMLLKDPSTQRGSGRLRNQGVGPAFGGAFWGILVLTYLIYILCWWFRNPVNSPVEVGSSPVEVGSLSHCLQGFSTIPGGCLGFLPSTVLQSCRDFLESTSFGGAGVEVFSFQRIWSKVLLSGYSSLHVLTELSSLNLWTFWYERFRKRLSLKLVMFEHFVPSVALLLHKFEV